MKSLTSLFHEKLQEAGYHNSTCCFCGIRQGSQMAHIVSKSVAHKKDIEKAFNCTWGSARMILDMPLLNTIWSCPECNGLGDTKNAKVCKTVDLSVINSRLVKACSDVVLDKVSKIKVKKNWVVIHNFYLWLADDNKTLDKLKEIQYDFQKIILGYTA